MEKQDTKFANLFKRNLDLLNNFTINSESKEFAFLTADLFEACIANREFEIQNEILEDQKMYRLVNETYYNKIKFLKK